MSDTLYLADILDTAKLNMPAQRNLWTGYACLPSVCAIKILVEKHKKSFICFWKSLWSASRERRIGELDLTDNPRCPLLADAGGAEFASVLTAPRQKKRDLRTLYLCVCTLQQILIFFFVWR